MIRLLLLIALLAIGGAAHAFDPFQAAGIDEKPAAAVPLDRRFTQGDGTRTSLRALANGKPILLAPVLHRCPNICGVTLSGLMQAISARCRIPAGVAPALSGAP